jgi:hypothetical protein
LTIKILGNLVAVLIGGRQDAAVPRSFGQPVDPLLNFERLPAEFRQMDRIEPGQEFDVERVDRGDYRLVRRVAPRNEGALDWLLACPHKDFFVPIDSESTDTL